MANEKDNVRSLMSIISYSDEEYDVGVDIDVSTEHNFAALTTAFAELVTSNKTFAQIWSMANAAIARLEFVNNDETKNKIIN